MDSLVRLFGASTSQTPQTKSEKVINRVQTTKRSVANGMSQLEGELDQALKDKEKKKREYKIAIVNKDSSKKEIIGRSILELDKKIKKLQIGLQSISAHQSTLDTVHYTHMISGLGSEVLELTKTTIPDIDDVEEMNEDMIDTRTELDTLFVAMSGPSVESDLKQSMGDLDDEIAAELEQEQEKIMNPRIAELENIKTPVLNSRTPIAVSGQTSQQQQARVVDQGKPSSASGGPRRRLIV